MSYPETYKYTKEHEWVNAQGETGTVGITDHAQHELGDIVFVELPKIGKHIKKGDTLGSVESVKAVNDIYSPVSGEIVEVNDLLSKSPEKLNEDPQGEAWLAKIKLSAPGEINELMPAADYQKYIGAE
jgi:glycine cleavage system H protein